LNYKKKNYLGPLKNGVYVNNGFGIYTWNVIKELLLILKIELKQPIFVHYPFQREPR